MNFDGVHLLPRRRAQVEKFLRFSFERSKNHNVLCISVLRAAAKQKNSESVLEETAVMMLLAVYSGVQSF